MSGLRILLRIDEQPNCSASSALAYRDGPVGSSRWSSRQAHPPCPHLALARNEAWDTLAPRLG